MGSLGTLTIVENANGNSHVQLNPKQEGISETNAEGRGYGPNSPHVSAVSSAKGGACSRAREVDHPVP